jgi:outer membrane protein OmpA-like peptidoglycan-associated protein
MNRFRTTIGLCAVALLASSAARAEPLLLTLEGDFALPLTAPQTERFGPGAALGVGVLYPLRSFLLVGARGRAGFLADGDPPADPGQRDPGLGGYLNLHGVVRLRLPGAANDVRRAVGPFVEGGGGATVTGDLVRGSLEAGLGWGLPVGKVALAPSVRFVQVVQGADPLSDEDARLLLIGVELTLLDARPGDAPPPPPAPPSDRDGDGLLDREDTCPDEPEDADGHDDADGCPDPDNDGDGLLDADDKCPDGAEDPDGFEDADGCPDPDNDADGFLDADDQCPNEAEVVNGNKDYDGCPDEGLIVLEKGRIVLEERVLFDLERARVKRAARPILAAIVNLRSQHPEWTGIRIEGHTDVRGDETYNLRLSERRAQNVMRELIGLGIPAQSIESIGYGASRLRDLREEEEAHHRNRRVEFVIETAAMVEQTPASEPGVTQGTALPADAGEELDPPTSPTAKEKAR